MSTLLNNVNTNTVGTPTVFENGKKTLYINADDLDGGTIDLEIKHKDDSEARWKTLEDGTFTAAGAFSIDKLIDITSKNYAYRAVLAGATTPVNVFVSID